jgi:prepilin-type N-terminal cleavage/methylation domain-containing protein
MKRTAFTLIELLVVIAVIGILAGLMLPVLGKVRDSAKQVDCMSRQRQLSMVMLLYVTSNRGIFPSWIQLPSGEMWYSLISPENDWKRSVGGMKTRDDQYVALLFCSEDKTLSKIKPTPTETVWEKVHKFHFFSHGYNKYGLPDSRISQVSNSSETIMLGDSYHLPTAMAYIPDPSWVPEGVGYAGIDHNLNNLSQLYPRHSRGMTAVFSCVDGRVVKLRAGAPYDSTRLYQIPSFGGIGTGQQLWNGSLSWWDPY